MAKSVNELIKKINKPKSEETISEMNKIMFITCCKLDDVGSACFINHLQMVLPIIFYMQKRGICNVSYLNAVLRKRLFPGVDTQNLASIRSIVRDEILLHENKKRRRDKN